MKQAEEIAICTSCALPSCVGDQSARCPLWQARRAENQSRLPYFKSRYEQRRDDRANNRGYFPDIHSALRAERKQDDSEI